VSNNDRNQTKGWIARDCADRYLAGRYGESLSSPWFHEKTVRVKRFTYGCPEVISVCQCYKASLVSCESRIFETVEECLQGLLPDDLFSDATKCKLLSIAKKQFCYVHVVGGGVIHFLADISTFTPFFYNAVQQVSAIFDPSILGSEHSRHIVASKCPWHGVSVIGRSGDIVHVFSHPIGMTRKRNPYWTIECVKSGERGTAQLVPLILVGISNIVQQVLAVGDAIHFSASETEHELIQKLIESGFFYHYREWEVLGTPVTTGLTL